jgi:NAD(P)-dependent dehydrogenase (short-subunit alcohol dehydrogenase family)
MSDPLRLYGLKALVTSAASGVGEAVARTLVKHGAIVLAVDTPASAIEQQFASVKGITGMAASIGDAGQLPAMIETAARRLGKIDILVNEYPLGTTAAIRISDDSFERLLATRAELISAACRSALPHLRKSPSGRIINIGLLRSVFSTDGDAACLKAEQNLADVTRALAIETGEFGVTATYVQPGAIMTPVSRKVFNNDKALRDFCIANSAAKRLGEPIDVAKVVLFLASDESMFVNGTGIRVDGGPAAG